MGVGVGQLRHTLGRLPVPWQALMLGRSHPVLQGSLHSGTKTSSPTAIVQSLLGLDLEVQRVICLAGVVVTDAVVTGPEGDRKMGNISN